MVIPPCAVPGVAAVPGLFVMLSDLGSWQDGGRLILVVKGILLLERKFDTIYGPFFLPEQIL